jgi:phytol kinase
VTGYEWLCVLVVVLILAAGLPAVRAITSRCGASPEVSRKSVHVLMGLVCVSFPWVFDRPLPVWVLAAAATIPLAVVRSIPALRSGVGSALHGIKRPSYGEVLFAPAVAAVFHFSGGDPYLHGIPIGILTLADAASAVGGTRWGRRNYGVGEGFKTVEGSLIFLTTAFLCVFLPLFLGGRVDMIDSLWIALILATLAMMAEGISDRGFDNLVIPLGCIFALDRLLLLDTPALTWRFVVLVVLLVLVLAGSRWSTLNGGALLGSVLLGYGCAILADWRFALPPSGVFISHLVTTRKHHLIKSFDHRLDAVVSHALAAMPWVVAVALDLLPIAQGLVGVSFAMMAQLAILDTATRNSVPGLSVRPLRAVMKGALIAALPGLVWFWSYGSALVVPAVSAVAATLLAILWFDRLSRSWRSGDTSLWMVKGLLALAVSLTAFLFRP